MQEALKTPKEQARRSIPVIIEQEVAIIATDIQLASLYNVPYVVLD